VLGISGGVDLTAGLLAQRAMRELRQRTGDEAYKFIAVRLPYETQFDEHDAQASVDFIEPDERHTVNIGPAVKSLANEVAAFEGNTRCRWISCSATPRRGCAWSPSTPSPARPGPGDRHRPRGGSGDGLFHQVRRWRLRPGPAQRLVKNQVRAIPRHFGAPESLVEKVRPPTWKTCRRANRTKRPTA
jgi:NAD+ synthase